VEGKLEFEVVNAILNKVMQIRKPRATKIQVLSREAGKPAILQRGGNEEVKIGRKGKQDGKESGVDENIDFNCDYDGAKDWARRVAEGMVVL